LQQFPSALCVCLAINLPASHFTLLEKSILNLFVNPLMMSDEIKKSFYENQEEEAKRRAAMYEENVRMLQTEERFQKFFEGYNARSVESFIKWYAGRRVDWHLKGDSYRRAITYINNKDRNEAKKFLSLIFIKKVFNLKCRWIAGEMDLPFIECSDDFDTWQDNLPLQQYIGPITDAELECMITYRNQTNSLDCINMDINDLPVEMSLREFHRQRVRFNCNKQREVTGWFHFYDKHFGTAGLMDLPLIRKELETDYNDLWKIEFYYPTLSPEQLKIYKVHTRKELAEIHADPEKEKAYYAERKKRQQEAPKYQDKYILLFTRDDKQMNELMKLCETNEMRSYYNAQHEYHRRHDAEEEMRNEFDYLQRLTHNVPIQSNDDFREAVKEIYQTEKMDLVNQQLRLVHQECCRTIAENRLFDWDKAPYSITGDNVKQHILEMKKMRGEPENFDFLKKENLPHFA